MLTHEKPLAGRTALITGASRGIGAASAHALAALGAHVIVTYRRDAQAAKRLTTAINAASGRAEALRLDIETAGAVSTLVAEAQASSRQVDILVANAAAGYPKVPLMHLNADDLVGKVAADLRATHLLTTGLAPAMLESGFGRLIYVSSGHVDGPSAAGMTANGASKAALETYVKFVVDELTGDGVTANLVRPGLVDTDATRGRLPAAAVDTLVAATPAGRVAAPQDVAEVVAFLATSGDMVNGACIPVTGGLANPFPLLRLHQWTQDHSSNSEETL